MRLSMPDLRFSVKAAALAAALLCPLSAPAPGQAAPGSAPVTGGSTGVCSSGGCVPISECGKGGVLCSTFPDHPAYDPNEEFRRGIAAMNAKDYRKAAWSFDRVLYLAPTNSDVFFAKGVAETGLGDLPAAAEAFTKALKYSPRQINAARELALTEIRLGQIDQAKTRLDALRARSAKCAGRCADAGELGSAIQAVEDALPRG